MNFKDLNHSGLCERKKQNKVSCSFEKGIEGSVSLIWVRKALQHRWVLSISALACVWLDLSNL